MLLVQLSNEVDRKFKEALILKLQILSAADVIKPRYLDLAIFILAQPNISWHLSTSFSTDPEKMGTHREADR